MKFLRLVVAAVFFSIVVASCAEEEGPACAQPFGEMKAIVNDTLELDFRFVYFKDWRTDSTLLIKAEFINAGCEIELSITFANITKNKKRQTLVKRIFEDGDSTKYTPFSIFYTWNVDVLTERFEIYEKEPSWLELTELSEDRILGSFQATYLYREGAQRFWDLPDTLRFQRVHFEALAIDPIED